MREQDTAQAGSLRPQPILRARSRRGRALRVVYASATVLLLVLLVAAATVTGLLFRSRAQLDGSRRVAGVGAPVRIERDGLGVPTIMGENRQDVAFALGFVHAQDRFFQMDLLRRSAAGELAALLGPQLVEADRRMRVHRFRALARRNLQALPDRALAEAYTQGVNTGLAALGAPPFEYLLLRSRPQEWHAEDVLLCVFAMYADLQYTAGELESALGVLHDVLPAPLADFLDARGTEWDAPLVGQPIAVPPVPGPAVFDLRREPRLGGVVPDGQSAGRHVGIGAAGAQSSAEEPILNGSNNWAVAGSASANGGALLAGDMHLGLSVPNIWYRASLAYTDAHGSRRRATGVTLPGTPALVAGSNGDVAWAFTNSEIDFSDLVVLELTESLDPTGVPADPGERRAPPSGWVYLAPGGPREFERHLEVIRVRGAPNDTLEVTWTIWGPVVDRDHAGRWRAYRWIAHDEEAVNFGLVTMEAARTLDEAVAIAHRTRIPTQNCLIVDRTGRIAWTLIGPVPRRFGCDGRVPQSWTGGACGWRGYLSPDEVPSLVDPPSGRLWTANNRVLDGERLRVLGDGGYALGARARQIRAVLSGLDAPTALDMLRLQLDDRALFLQRWHDLLLAILSRDVSVSEPRRAELRAYVENWGGRAAIGSVGYRAVREFRTAVTRAVLDPLLAACRAGDPRLRDGHLLQREGPVWRLVQEQPLHLLDPRYSTWDALLVAAADTALARLLAHGPDLAARTWGEVNTSRIRHPVSRALPILKRFLDMPAHPLPGDRDMPRVQSPTAGASQRMVVSPGKEEQGFSHMPCGQSGHPLSPFYRNSHLHWEDGDPTPFLPGPAQHMFSLLPD